LFPQNFRKHHNRLKIWQVLAEGMGRLLVDGSPGNDFVDVAKPRAAWTGGEIQDFSTGIINQL